MDRKAMHSSISSNIMEKICDISNLSLEPMTDSQFVKPYRLRYSQNGKPKIWDLVAVHKSVATILYNVERKKVIAVKQFRPAVYFNNLPKEERNKNGKIDTGNVPISSGVTIELCAGIVDRKDELVNIAQSEVLEECGYKVPVQNFERIQSHRSGVGMSGELQTLFYAEVNDSMKVSTGGGLDVEGEMIEVVELSIDEVNELLEQPEVNCPGAFLYALLWFKCNKLVKY